MKITELKRKLAEREKKVSSPSNAAICGWNPNGETPPEEEVVTLELLAEEDAEYEPSEDDEQTFREALSLLDTARDLLLAQAQFLDARNLQLPGDQDWAVTVTCSDIRQFLNANDYQKEVKPKAERKTIVCYPARMAGIVSHECRHTQHDKCPLVNCDCLCHAHEMLEESVGRAMTNNSVKGAELAPL